MNTRDYYCPDCANSLGLLPRKMPPSLFNSSYQIGKVEKHTTLTATSGWLSIFTSATPEAYHGYVLSAVLSGCVEVDQKGKQFIWFADTPPGITHKDGQYHASANAVRVVWPENDTKVHAYPVDLSTPPKRCTSCDRLLPQVAS